MFFNHKKLKSPFNYLSRGFTLTEVLVIVLVIAVLMAIAYPLYTKAISKARAVEAINLLEIVRTKQVTQYVRTRGYYKDFDSMGQLTNNKAAEHANGTSITINDYTVKIDNQKECLTAEYDKGGVKFTMSASYSKEGLGCTGDICESFGSMVGSAEDVCAQCSTGDTTSENCNNGRVQGCTAGKWDGNCQCPPSAPYEYNDICNVCPQGQQLINGVCDVPCNCNSSVIACGSGNGCPSNTQCRVCDGCHWGSCYCESNKTWNGNACVPCCTTGDTSTNDCSNGKQKTCANCAWNSCQCPTTAPHEYNNTCNVCPQSTPYEYNNTCNKCPQATPYYYDDICNVCPQGEQMINGNCTTCACEDGDTDAKDCPAGQQKTCANCAWGTCACPAGKELFGQECYCSNNLKGADSAAMAALDSLMPTEGGASGTWTQRNCLTGPGMPTKCPGWRELLCNSSGSTWWNNDTCTCDCPSATHTYNNYKCECNNANTTINGTTLKGMCEIGYTGYGNGTWNDATCDCDCPAGTAWHPEQGCIPSPNCAPFWQYGTGIYTAGNGDRYLSYGIYYCGAQGKIYEEEYDDNTGISNCYCQPCGENQCLERHYRSNFNGYIYQCIPSLPTCSGATMRKNSCLDSNGVPTGNTEIWYWEGCPSAWVQKSWC